jgi:diamine N-acetyltransferase
MNQIRIEKINRNNYEKALFIKVKRDQKKFVPSVQESLMYAYVIPWDEAFDPYLVYKDQIPVGFFYISYTPDSIDNYWIGGFQVDKKYQNQGIGKLLFQGILDFIKNEHPCCKVISLTVEKSNIIASKLYESFGFTCTNSVNPDDEVIYRLNI